MMYPVSFLFHVPSAAYITMIVVNLFIGLTATLATYILDSFSYDSQLDSVNKVLKNFLLIFPNYCLGRGILDVAANEYVAQYDELMSQVTGGSATFTAPLTWDIAGRNVVFMALQMMFWLVAIMVVEYRGWLIVLWQKTKTRWGGKSTGGAAGGGGVVNGVAADNDVSIIELDSWSEGNTSDRSISANTIISSATSSVEKETARLSGGSCKDNLKVINLRKSYQKADVSQ